MDALNENDGTSKPCHNLSSRHGTNSSTSIPSNNDDIFQDETFSRGGKRNLRPNPKSNFSDSYRYKTRIKYSLTTKETLKL